MVDPLGGERGDRPCAYEGLPLAVGDDPQRAARVLLVDVGAGDGLNQVDGGRDSVDPLLERLLLAQADRGDLGVGEDDAGTAR